VAGWSGIGKTEEGNNNFYYLKSIPYDWLFPQVAAVVYHGGAGTLAAALWVGVPQLWFTLSPTNPSGHSKFINLELLQNLLKGAP